MALTVLLPSRFRYPSNHVIESRFCWSTQIALGPLHMFDPTSPKKIAVVTGGAGFLRSHLSDRLITEGFRVIVIDNSITGSLDNIAHLAGNRDFRFSS
jgi:hypothetical protein